jgi:type II secretory pathway pseudopilin PulG
MYKKKGAMFGLDARIALAIFGALSVISGAALYSAIQQSRVTATITEVSEITKAIEQYILDTGEDLDVSVATTLAYGELMASSKVGWKGPYLSYEEYQPTLGNNTHFAHTEFDRIAVDLRVSPEDGFNECSDASNVGKACYYWVFLGLVDSELKKAIDLQVDGTSDLSTGNIIDRGYSSSLYFKSIRSLKQY